MSTSSRLAVLLFTDIVGSTDLKGRLGAGAYPNLLQRHNDLFEQICRDERGDVLKHTGDGFFAAFTTASDAVRAALLFQHAIRSEPWPTPISVRIGIHVGEVAMMEMAGRPDVVGVAADLAARVMSISAGGQILLTRAAFNDARQFVAQHPAIDGQPVPALRWIAHGPYLFAGVEEPVELFEVGGEGVAPLKAPATVERARRVVPHDQEPTLGWRPAIGLAIPQRPGWSLEKRLGEGGFGEVWLGHHERTKQRRVFKFCFDADRLRSFKRELTLFRLLREALGERPDIARLYEVKLDEPPFFLESEWTEGGNLVDWAESRGGIATIPLEQRLEIVAKVADAVAAAHSVGILHKDIKPSNVLVQELPDKTIQPRLADFGIGFLADRSQLAARHITETGFTVITQTSGSSMTGTRLYAPPEVIAGKPFTTQGDIYALGVLLYQMAVGDLARPLAEGWERDVPDVLVREDVAACCDGDPLRRPAGAGEVAQRIRALPQRREDLRQREHAAKAAQRRSRVLRRSIFASVAMGLLVVAVAASSAFYIRRVRAAQKIADDQRVRAEKAEHDARQSAAAAQLDAAYAKKLAAFNLAQYQLSQWRVKEALEQALKASQPPARWEDGYLLQQVVAMSQRSWQPIGRVRTPELPSGSSSSRGCFVQRTGGEWMLALPRGQSVDLYTIPQGRRVASILCGGVVRSLCAAGPDRMLLASGRTVMLWDVSAVKQLALAQEQATIAQVVARPDADTVATLDDNGRVSARAAAADLALRGNYQIPLHEQRSVGAAPPGIALSPSGKRIAAYSGLWLDGFALWDWQTNTINRWPLNAHTVTFVDEEAVAGYWSWGVGMDEAAIWIQPLVERAEPQRFPLSRLMSKTAARIEIWNDPRQSPPSAGDIRRGVNPQTRAAIVGAEGVDIRDLSTGTVYASDLYASLLPQASGAVRVAAQDVPHGFLALTADDNDVVIFAARTTRPLVVGTLGWSMSTCDRGMLTCNLTTDPQDASPKRVSPASGPAVEEPSAPFRGELRLTPFVGADSRSFRLEWPTPPGKDVMPWGLWSPRDGSFVAILLQETEQGRRGGTIGGKYFKKSIAIYDNNDWPSPPALWKIKQQIPLPEFENADGRDNRFICVTPDRKTVAYCDYSGLVARYRVEDGKLLSKEKYGSWATPSQDGRLLVTGGISGQGVKVLDIPSGSVVFNTPQTGYARKACFSADGRYICVPWSGNKLTWYDLSTGAATRSLNTNLLPIAVPASGDQFVGFIPDTATTGSMVMASATTADAAAVLNPGANGLNAAWFDPSGSVVAMIQFRDEARIIRSITPQQALAALSYTNLPLATATTPTTIPTVTAKMPAPSTGSSTAPAIIPWTDAGSYIGQSVTVELKVGSTGNIGTLCFLNSPGQRHGNFVAVLTPPTFDKWPQPPEKWFADKTVRVHGVIEMYRGKPEIIVEHAKQIDIAE
jgi:class 3 adenylate cyclase/serine/threonine protein kinase